MEGDCIMNKLTLQELKNNKEWEKAVIVFTKDSFKEEYTQEERSYSVRSNAKYFDNTKIGNSLFGNCLDGKDSGVRLDQYIHALENEWKVEYCYIIE
jgi:hypothetical protein